MKVEFILAYVDGHWGTEIVDVPSDFLMEWGRKHFKSRKGLAYLGLYNTNVDDAEYTEEREVRDAISGGNE